MRLQVLHFSTFLDRLKGIIVNAGLMFRKCFSLVSVFVTSPLSLVNKELLLNTSKEEFCIFLPLFKAVISRKNYSNFKYFGGSKKDCVTTFTVHAEGTDSFSCELVSGLDRQHMWIKRISL